MEFPDTMPASVNMWATYIPNRSPEFKVHKNEGLANSAMGQRDLNESYAKYALRGGEWVKVYEYQPKHFCDWCSKNLHENEKDARGRYRTTRYRPPHSKKPKWQQPVICAGCYNTAVAQKRREEQEARERAELKRLQDKYKGV
jgi:hypothetical protein